MNTAIVAALSVTTFVLLGAVMAGVLYWRVIKKRRDSSRRWIIAPEEIKSRCQNTKSRVGLGSGLGTNVSLGVFSSYSSSSGDNMSGQLFTEQYSYMGEDVAGKKVVLCLKKTSTTMVEMSEELNMVIDLSHINICKFYGVCLTPGQEMSVWEYCRKGSLLDVLHNHKKYLDDIPFKVSFMTDITRGLKYLHRSMRGYHGNLKSANVLVDNKWTCKLAHMSITCLQYTTNEDEDKTNYRHLLSFAPEVLREPWKAIGSRPADIYSFGIILLEIFTVKEVQESFTEAYTTEQTFQIKQKSRKRKQKVAPEFSISDTLFMAGNIDPKDILSRVIQGGPLPFRPLIPETVDALMCTIIPECWRELPQERPTIEQLVTLVKRVSAKYSSSSKSLIEQMLDKVTREADVQAEELKEERNKSDNLLYQMLPSTVADCLKKQIEVKPETFQSASVYFSDIQGFTELASVSEPLQVVNFLNDIYYKFDSVIEQYHVYKVETIGDAYVVCSGVPVRMARHAPELAKMALHIMHSVQDLSVLHMPHQRFFMRIGLHSGPVAAGVVGRTMPRYCLFGDTVNTASRMESTGLAGRIQISQQCQILLEDDDFEVETREPFYVKGKGILQTYFLNGKPGFDPLNSNNMPSNQVIIDVRSATPKEALSV